MISSTGIHEYYKILTAFLRDFLCFANLISNALVDDITKYQETKGVLTFFFK